MKLTKAILFFAALLQFNQAVAQQINKKLAAQLANIYKEDQRYRVAAIAAAKKYGAYSVQDNALMKKQDAVDRANLIRIEQIIATYGYPGKSLVGKQANVAFMVVQHNDTEAQEKYLPIFVAAAEKGELDRSLLPLMIDRVLRAKGEPQLYGTQLKELKNGQVKIAPITDEINVDVRRKAAGLPPLATYLKQWGITYIVPTAAGNTNPKELYEDSTTEKQKPVEAIGGDEGIFAKLIYPEQAKAKQIVGTVLVEFTVAKDGITKNIVIVKSLGYGCDEEAIRVIKATKYQNNTGEDAELRMKLPFPYNKK